MTKYAIQVLVAAVVLAAVVWFGLPKLKSSHPEQYSKLAAWVVDGEAPAKLASGISQAKTQLTEAVKDIGDELAGTTEQEESDTADETRLDDSISSSPTASSEMSDDAHEGNGDAETIGTPNAVAPAASESAALASEVESEPQEPAPGAVLNPDPGYNWGIVVTNSFFYDAQMKPQGIMLGGTVVARKSSRLLPDGNVAECCYLKEGRQWVYETVHIYEADLVLFDMPYEKADPAQRDLLVEYCQLYGRYEAAKAKLYKDIAKRNPYLADHQETAQSYREFLARAKTLHEEHEAVTGPRRSAIQDELRKMKGQEQDVKRRYEEAKARYDAWKRENVTAPAETGRLKTPDMQSLENQMKALRPAVQEIVPGL
ncbi:MAG: hypothetical protein ACOX9C_02805 [Kiritimatiellia bacterium]|jgi:hypothetical protein